MVGTSSMREVIPSRSIITLVLLFLSHLFEDVYAAQLEPRSIDTSCPTSDYTTPDGLQFDVHCNRNLNAGNDSSMRTTASSLSDCMNKCSSWRPECYGVAFNATSGSCYPKKETHPVNSTNVPDIHSALVAPVSQLASLNKTCPYANNSIQTTTDGLAFKIDCGNDQPYGDYQPDGLLNEWDASNGIHTDTLEECMQYCAEAHPLCLLLAWNPDQIAGYANCYLKKSLDGSPLVTANFVTHSAFSQISFSTVNNTCPVNSTYVPATTDRNFTIACDQNNDGTNLTALHTSDVFSCIDSCATNSTCVGVVFDSYMVYGYQNCYLKSDFGLPTPLQNWFSAALEGSTGSNTTSHSSTRHRSEGWIAGPVVGTIVIFAIVAVLFYMWRRRKNRSKLRKQEAFETVSQQDNAGPYYHNPRQDHGPYEMAQAKSHQTHFEVEGVGPKYELDGRVLQR